MYTKIVFRENDLVEYIRWMPDINLKNNPKSDPLKKINIVNGLVQQLENACCPLPCSHTHGDHAVFELSSSHLAKKLNR